MNSMKEDLESKVDGNVQSAFHKAEIVEKKQYRYLLLFHTPC